MKIIISSDIHVSTVAANAVIAAAKKEKADLLVLLGDLYYHGPRNPLPEGYAPMEVAAILNGYEGKKIVIRGNCDADVDGMISEFSFVDGFAAEVGGKTVYFTHGHTVCPENPPKGFDVLCNGHFHVAKIWEENGVIFANPGSCSLPKENTVKGYLLLEESGIRLKAFSGEEVALHLW